MENNGYECIQLFWSVYMPCVRQVDDNPQYLAFSVLNCNNQDEIKSTK